MNKYNSDHVLNTDLHPEGKGYLHTLQAGAWLPFLQASITGLIMGLCALGLGLLWNTRHPGTTGLIFGLIAWAAAWLLLQRHWYSLTTWKKITGQGEPIKATGGKHVTTLYINEVKDNGHIAGVQHRMDLPATSEQLYTLADGLINQGRSFSHLEWTGGPGAPFTDGQFRELRSEMLKRGLITPASLADHRRGFVLTVLGKHTLRGFLDHHSPTLQDDTA
jgi:hypothetical protein